MKIMICTSRIRPDGQQTVFPPLGAMAIVQSLVKAGYEDTYLYDIDGTRPPYDDVIKRLEQDKPEIVGISGVVSTSYAFIKKLIATINMILPGTPVIVGGNVAASSEILHRLAGVDYCVIGEGEQTSIDLISYLQGKGDRTENENYEILRSIQGITFLNDRGTVEFTGYRPNIPADGLYDLDYDLLERDTDISKYIIEPWLYTAFLYDQRSFESHRIQQKLATLVTTKGCVAKCTFCHRWDKGIRFVGVDQIIERIKMLKERYNVGFVSFADENFGSNRKWVEEFVQKIQTLDVLWRVGGVRCRTVDIEMLTSMREAGCVQVQYGIESGSQRMLDVMEKNATVEMNRNAVMWTHEAGIKYLVYSMLFGMPGETPETIGETIEFLKDMTEFLPDPPYNKLSMNRLEALPGTPVYEYAKVTGLIGRTPEAEEQYLLYISDTSGGETGMQLNFTDYPDFIVQSWKRVIWMEVMHNWLIKHPERQANLLKLFWNNFRILFISQKTRVLRHHNLKDTSKGRELIDSFVDRDYNARRDEFAEQMIGMQYHPALYFTRRFAILERITKDFLDPKIPKRIWLSRCKELALFYIRGSGKEKFDTYQSMRKTMDAIRPEPLSESERNLIPLIKGR